MTEDHGVVGSIPTRPTLSYIFNFENIYKIKTTLHIMVKKKSVNKELPGTKEGLGISGFILGILSLVWAGSIFIGVPLAITGFILCRFQQKKSPMRLAKIGTILNIIGFVLGIIIFVLLIFLSPLIQGNLPLA